MTESAILSLHYAARHIQGVPRGLPGRESRKMPDVHSTHKKLLKQAKLYELTDGRAGLGAFREKGTRNWKVYKTELTRWVKERDEANHAKL